MKRKLISALTLSVLLSMSLAGTSCGKEDDPTPDNIEQNNGQNPGQNNNGQNNSGQNNNGQNSGQNNSGQNNNEQTPGQNNNEQGNGEKEPETPIIEMMKVVIDGKEQEVEKNSKITLPEFENEKFGYDAEYKDSKGNSYKPGDEISVAENLDIKTVYTAQDHTYTLEKFREFMLAADKAEAYDNVFDIIITDLTDYNQNDLYGNFDDYNFSKVKLNVTIAANDDLTMISDHAFSNIKNIKKLVLPEGIIFIERNAFQKNGIQEIVLPESLKSIEIQAFDGCTSLKNVTFPAGIISFGNVLFQDCKSIETVTILSEEIKSWGYNMLGNLDYTTGVYGVHPTIKTVYVKASMLDWFKEKFPLSADIFKAL